MNIVVEGLTKKYESQKAVDNISFEVKTLFLKKPIDEREVNI